jgi:hypothetical protein
MSSTANVASVWGVPRRSTHAPRGNLSFTPVLTRGDRLIWLIAIIAIYLETVVYIEPAPVDGVIVGCLIVALLSGKIDFSRIGAVAIVSVNFFGLMCLISLYEAVDVGRAVSYLAVTLYLISSWLFFAGLLGRYGKPLLTKLINAYSITGLVSALLGAGAYFHVIPYQDILLLNGRARGLFKDCNVYGPFFVPMAFYALVRIADRREGVRAKAWQAIVLAAALLAMVLSYSRGCWLNFGVALAVFFAGQIFLAPPQERRRELVRNVTAVAVAGVGLLLFLNIPMIHEMMNSRVNEGHTQYYDSMRFATQELALESAKSRPFGIGPGQSEIVFLFSTHSVYLRVLSENGPLALLALLIFMGSAMYRCVALMRLAVDPWIRGFGLAVFACIVGNIANSFVIDSLHWRSVWLLYSLPWVMTPLARYVRAVPAMNRTVLRGAQAAQM